MAGQRKIGFFAHAAVLSWLDVLHVKTKPEVVFLMNRAILTAVASPFYDELSEIGVQLRSGRENDAGPAL